MRRTARLATARKGRRSQPKLQAGPAKTRPIESRRLDSQRGIASGRNERRESGEAAEVWPRGDAAFVVSV